MSLKIKNVEFLHGEKELLKGDILIENGKIAGLNTEKEQTSLIAEREIDGEKCLALPGLVNCHTHAAMVYTRGYADDKPLMTWLEDYIWPLEARLTPEDIYWGTLLAITEMLASGTTTFTDMYFAMDKAGEAVEQSGIRAVLTWGLIGLQDNAIEKLEKTVEFAREWRGGANGRIQTMLAPHAPYTCPPPFMEKVLQKAAQNDLPIHIHLAETRDEIEQMEKEYGKTPVKWALDIGVFENKTLAAHCVHLNEEDINILKEKQVGVAYNPQSNMKLASGVAPIGKLLENGIKVGFGTDGPGSNNSLDMFSEMKMGSFLQKVISKKSQNLPAGTVINMATARGAEIIGLGSEIGSLQKGKKADIILLNLDKPHLTPIFDPLAHVVYSCRGSDVQTTIVDGNILYHKGEFHTLDVEKIKWEVRKRTERLTKKKK